jgi:leucyl-tRNA synthetase
VTTWVNLTAGEAGVDPDLLAPDTPVRRETNTMPGWAGSCWYYLRYCDPHNSDRFVSREAEAYWMLSKRGTPSPKHGPQGEEQFDVSAFHIGGVDLYIGGAEHAVLHLLYARFWHKILFDLGEVSTPEPIGKLFHQGMLTAYAFKNERGTLVPSDEVVETEGGTFVEKASGDAVVQFVAKMSKSLRNVVNPDDVIKEYGSDTFRLYEMYMGPLEASAPWSPRDIVGVYRFLQRVWRLAVNEETGAMECRADADSEVERALHRMIAKVSGDLERLGLNTAIAAMIEFVNAATGVGVTKDQLGRFACVLAPFAPHIAEELWHRVGNDQSVVLQSWPEADEAMLREESIEVAVQILGKVRSRITVSVDADAAALEAAALADERIVELLEGKAVLKVIVVPGKLVNIVAS